MVLSNAWYTEFDILRIVASVHRAEVHETWALGEVLLFRRGPFPPPFRSGTTQCVWTRARAGGTCGGAVPSEGRFPFILRRSEQILGHYGIFPKHDLELKKTRPGKHSAPLIEPF